MGQLWDNNGAITGQVKEIMTKLRGKHRATMEQIMGNQGCN